MADLQDNAVSSVAVQPDSAVAGHYDVVGVLNLDTVTSVESMLFEADAGGRVTINLAGVESADSAAVAVMLGWIQSIQKNGQSVHFEAFPAPLQSLVEIAGLGPFFATDH